MNITSLMSGGMPDAVTPGAAAGGNEEAGGGGFASMLKGLMASAERRGRSAAAGKAAKADATAEDPEMTGTEKAKALFEQLKKELLEKGVSLTDLAVDPKALDALEKFLLKAGFNKAEVAQLMAELKESAGKTGLTLAEVFTRVMELSESSEDDEDTPYADIAMVPFIESALAAYGLDAKAARKVMDGVVEEGKGVNISRLAANLRKYLGDHPEMGSKTAEDATDILSRLLSGFGMKEDGDPEKMTLGTLVGKLENLSAGSGDKAVDKEGLEKALALFADGIREQADDKAAKAAALAEETVRKASAVKKGESRLADAAETAARAESGEAAADERPKLKKDAPGPGTPSEKAAADSREKGLFAQQMKSTEAVEADARPTASRLRKGAVEPRVVAAGATGADTSDKAAEAAAPKPVAKPVPAYLVKQVSRQIVRSVQNGQNEIRLQLKPPSLGRIQIRMEGSGHSMRVNIVTEQPHARELLLGNTQELRHVLEEQGVRLEKIDVTISYDFDQAMADSRREWQSRQGSRGKGFSLSGGEDAGPETVAPPSKPAGGGVKILDLVA